MTRKLFCAALALTAFFAPPLSAADPPRAVEARSGMVVSCRRPPPRSASRLFKTAATPSMPRSPPPSPWPSRSRRPATSAAAASCSSIRRRQGRAGRHRLPRDGPRRPPRHDDVRQGQRHLVQPQGRRRARHRARPGPGPQALRQAALEGRRRCPAVKLAEDGFVIDESLAGSLNCARRQVASRLPSCGACSARTAARTLAGRRPAGAAGPGRTLRRDRRARGRTPSTRARRRPDRRRDEGRRRPHHDGGPGRLQGRASASRSTAPTAATTSTARRRPVPAAPAWSRCSTSWRTSTCASRAAGPPRRCT